MGGSLLLLNVARTTLFSVVTELGGTVSSGVARFSPDGRYIVYDRTPGKVAALDLFVLDVAGTLDFWAIRVADGMPQGTPVRVKNSVGRVAPLGFAQDGSFYYADVKVARDVYAARVDFQTGRVLRPAERVIVKFEGSNMNPRYSPDQSLAYVSRRGSMVFPTARGNALCVYSLDTGGERVFLDEFAKLGVRVVAGPRWSPDSHGIAVAGLLVVGARSGLYLVSVETGEVKPVAVLPGWEVVGDVHTRRSGPVGHAEKRRDCSGGPPFRERAIHKPGVDTGRKAHPRRRNHAIRRIQGHSVSDPRGRRAAPGDRPPKTVLGQTDFASGWAADRVYHNGEQGQ